MDLFISYYWTVILKCKEPSKRYVKRTFKVIGEDYDWAIRGAMTKASDSGAESFYVIKCTPTGIAIAFDRYSPEVNLLGESDREKLWKVDPTNPKYMISG